MKTLLYKTLFYLNFFIIEYLALTPRHIEIIESFWDKQNHFVAFLVLYLLLGMAYRDFSTAQKTVIMTFIAFQIEIVQYFIPGRYFSLLDIAADAIGVIAGIIVYRYLVPKFHLGN
ncbi:VanZ family protein [Sulfuricurvum kujiense DSM 16994]|uniref:VanZ family protein n=1 Tax=Sulfuricurvum kujiense (strain ATCC BAA-921 / DSM 16994 / JCM 11577 / YK-1) TaxID=709032 RepID=E4U0C3_SULKY|nr:VanZ family protein [Sulfuricurvum kujiense]ADR33220.1 VanZ family protein [Sulfuricurvum kujiense DSM 16994]